MKTRVRVFSVGNAANAKALAGSLGKYARPNKDARSVRRVVREQVAHAAAAED